MKIIIFITTFERPEMLLDLLKQIKKQGKSYNLKLIINNDHSVSNYSKAISYLRRYFDDFYYVEDNIHRGKRNYWHIINKIYEMMRNESFDYFIQIPDDVKLVPDFFEITINKFDAIQDSNKACLNIANDYGRNGHSFWVNVKPKYCRFQNHKYILSGWVDMAYICVQRYFELLDYRVKKVDSNWSGKPGRSSGVGLQITQRLYAARASIYQVANSLIIHGTHESVMHPEHRKETPLISNHMKDKIIATMATMPTRIEALKESIASLLPQIDELRVYLNNFESIPEFLTNKKIIIFDSRNEVGDLGDVGKFYNVDKIKGYHFMVDDDLIYPEDYVIQLIEQIEKHKRKYIIGLHGRIFGNIPVKSYYKGHTESFRCLGDVPNDAFVHITGTGASAYHTDTINISIDDFETSNMADIWFSRKANNCNIPVLVIKHNKGWLIESKKYNPTQSIYYNCHKNDIVQTDVVNETKWCELKINTDKIKVLPKVESVKHDKKDIIIGYRFECPGCKFSHMLHTEYKNSFGAIWKFNGDVDKPTFKPSLFINKGKINVDIPLCHSYITNGTIKFLNDSTHELAGKTVELKDIDN